MNKLCIVLVDRDALLHARDFMHFETVALCRPSNAKLMMEYTARNRFKRWEWRKDRGCLFLEKIVDLDNGNVLMLR